LKKSHGLIIGGCQNILRSALAHKQALKAVAEM